MGKSYIEYKEFGFWSPDSYIESWLTTLIAEMEELATLEEWQSQLIAHWRVQAIIGGGCMWVGLNDYLTDPLREQFILAKAKLALDLCQPLGRKTGELFIQLLEGKLRTNASSPIDYL